MLFRQGTAAYPEQRMKYLSALMGKCTFSSY